MPTSINNNFMAANVASNLSAHYGRLTTSVQRLSSGLRINSSADDAAGLAIRELMRADVAALNRGARNANDAISMLQVADGALAIIDEKLIRMKELAEQAATGTYNSTQRLLIDSEYQAMAEEIDRIARATDFNGIKLLDGSLSGAHNGKGLESTGMIKIHFGTGNDSAEDYYYVEIGDCTAKALGVGSSATGPGTEVTWTRVETLVDGQMTFKPAESYAEYVDPATGVIYYDSGGYYFSNLDDPVGTAIDFETDADIIERLERNQASILTNSQYHAYVDPVTNKEYWRLRAIGVPVRDPYDPAGTALDPSDPVENAIIRRLQRHSGGKYLDVKTQWDVFEKPDGGKYYTYNGGLTYVPDTAEPSTNVLEDGNPAHEAIINSLKPSPGVRQVGLPQETWFYSCYRDVATGKTYYSTDGGKTFVSDSSWPEDTLLDSVKDAQIIGRLKIVPEEVRTSVYFDTYRDPRTGRLWYTGDGGLTFLRNPNVPEEGVLDSADAVDAIIVARLEGVAKTQSHKLYAKGYQDTGNGNKLYYSFDGGKNYFDDLTNPFGSAFAASDPAYAGVVANLRQVDTRVEIGEQYECYEDSLTHVKYYTRDKGLTFFKDMDNPFDTLDPADGTHALILGRLVVVPERYSVGIYHIKYEDPLDGTIYYTNKTSQGKYYLSVRDPADIALDPASATDKAVIDRLDPVPKMVSSAANRHYPEDPFEVYVDASTNTTYYSHDGGRTYTTNPFRFFDAKYQLDASDPADKAVIDALQPKQFKSLKVEYIKNETASNDVMVDGATVSTQEAAQKALLAIDRAIVSKDKVRAHLGALQNRLENTVTNLNIQAENMRNAESRMSDADVANEMTIFVRNQILTQSAVAMLGQANSYPHMLMDLISG